MKFEVPKDMASRPTLSIDMVQRVLRWERHQRCSSRKRQGSMAEKWKMKTRQDKRMVKLDKIAIFGHII